MSTTEPATRTDGDGTPEAPRSGRKGPGTRLIVLILVVVVVAAGFVVFAVRYRDAHNTTNDLRATGIPANVSTSLAYLMGLSPVPSRPAPDFTLVDQHGRTLSLSSFRGHPIVLEFMDPHCTDICPLVSEEFVDAYHDLGRAGRSVVFLAVNVNRYALSVVDVSTFSSAHGLDAIPTWHFFTGSFPVLRSIWAHYGIAVQSRGPTADVIHSSIVYFIGANGHERFLGTPMDDHTKAGTAYLPANQLSAWGKGIALVSQDLLSQR